MTEEQFDWWLKVGMAPFILAVGIVLGATVGRSLLRTDAVKAGVGEYFVADPKLGSTEFRWKTNR